MRNRTPETPDELVSDEDYLAERRQRHGAKVTARHWAQAGNDYRVTKAEGLQIVSRMGPTLYAIQYDDGVIKIGHTADLSRRLRGLHQTGTLNNHGSHFRLLAFRFGSYDDEQATHAALAAHRVHGREWYHPDPEVMAELSTWLHLGSVA